MSKIVYISSIILVLLVLPIGFFYTPNLSIYVLGSIREGILNGWLFANFTFVIGLAIAVYLLIKGVPMSWRMLVVFIVILIGLIVLHGIPSMIYWDYISSGSIIRDDTATVVSNPSTLMFVWHCMISSLAIFIMSMSIISKVKARIN